ncbi:GAF domain-containing protein [Pseudonocardia benzenivorans]
MTISPADLLALLLDLGAPSAAGALSAAGGPRPAGSAVETAVVALVRDRVPGAASVSVTRRVGARPATAAASDPLAERADRIQYEVGEGPCLHALTAGEPVRLDLTATDDRRWPGFRSRMRAETAIRSVLSHPLPDVVPASLNVYLATPPPGTTSSPRPRSPRASCWRPPRPGTAPTSCGRRWTAAGPSARRSES